MLKECNTMLALQQTQVLDALERVPRVEATLSPTHSLLTAISSPPAAHAAPSAPTTPHCTPEDVAALQLEITTLRSRIMELNTARKAERAARIAADGEAANVAANVAAQIVASRIEMEEKFLKSNKKEEELVIREEERVEELQTLQELLEEKRIQHVKEIDEAEEMIQERSKSVSCFVLYVCFFFALPLPLADS